MCGYFTLTTEMLKRLLLFAGISVVGVGSARQLQPPRAAHAQGLLCKEPAERELFCGDGCEPDWYDWYAREASGYWEVTVTSESHCEDCCSEETCNADTAIDFGDTC